MREKVLIILVVAALGHPTPADEASPLRIELLAFTNSIAAQCESVKEQLKSFNVKADPLAGYTLQDAEQSLCRCMPAETQALKLTLSEEQLEQPVTEQQFLDLMKRGVFERCSAEQLRAMYGDQCTRRFKLRGIDVQSYCTCMRGIVNAYTDAAAAGIAAASSEYLPEAAAAEKRGQTAPPRPPILQEWFQADQGCKEKMPEKP